MKKIERRAPHRLSVEAKKWWRKINQEYQIDDQAGLLLLQTALESFDRMRRAQEQVAERGMVSTDRFGQLKPHPLLTTERDARSHLMTALKQLNLDVEPLRDRLGRPGAK